MTFRTIGSPARITSTCRPAQIPNRFSRKASSPSPATSMHRYSPVIAVSESSDVDILVQIGDGMPLLAKAGDREFAEGLYAELR